MLERYNEELRRRTRVVRIFPNATSCLRLILALAAETRERWLTEQRYLYGRVSTPTGHCRKFLTQLRKKNRQKISQPEAAWSNPDFIGTYIRVYHASMKKKPNPLLKVLVSVVHCLHK